MKRMKCCECSTWNLMMIKVLQHCRFLLNVCLSVWIYICMSVCLFICPSPIHGSIFLSVSPFVRPSVRPSIRPSVRASNCPSEQLSVHPFICQFLCLSLYLSVQQTLPPGDMTIRLFSHLFSPSVCVSPSLSTLILKVTTILMARFTLL
jgi:hypothetical protein